MKGAPFHSSPVARPPSLVVAAWLAATAASAATLEPGKTEVVVAPDAPKTVLFAAEELTNFLAQALGAPVPVATAPTGEGRTPVFLGSNEWTRATGIDTAPMPRDAFAIVSREGAVFVAGRDDPVADTRRAIESPKAGVWAQLHEHATLFGAYELLERFAGVRMYFPGELGTIVPRADRIEIPEGRIDVAPDFLVRNYSNYDDGLWFEGEDRALYKHPLKKLNYVRQRMQTQYVPCCHGTSYFGLQRRFAAEHPEYFALWEKNGALVRDVDPAERHHHPGQLCHSSRVYDEIFADILSYERGEGPDVRGIADPDGWPLMAFRLPWVDVMPQDGFVECRCDACQAAYDKSRKHYATELVWNRTVELAHRLSAAGSAIRITQMAYPPYRDVPTNNIPDNVDVMVAETGPWSIGNADELAREQAEIRAWCAKLGRRVWTWVYPNKFGNRFVPDVPNGTPRAWAAWVKGVAPSIFGVFMECENDRFLYNSLCYHVLGRVCWDNGADVEAILDEYFRLMFGAGAEPMAALFEDVERKWLHDVRGNFVDGPLGPERQTPSEYQIFAVAYDRATVARWDAWLRDAATRVPEGSLEARRVALFRRELLDPLAKRVADYADTISVGRELARRAANLAATNLLLDADFSAPPAPAGAPRRRYGLYDDPERARGWRGGWACDADADPCLSLVDDVPPGASGKALRMTVEGEPRIVRLENEFARFTGKFEPGRRYRVSFFVRLTDVVSHGNGGVGCRVWHDRNEWFPRNRMTGTTGWIHQEFFFTAGDKSADFNSQFAIHLWNATGTVDWADLRIEPAP